MKMELKSIKQVKIASTWRSRIFDIEIIDEHGLPIQVLASWTRNPAGIKGTVNIIEVSGTGLTLSEADFVVDKINKNQEAVTKPVGINGNVD